MGGRGQGARFGHGEVGLDPAAELGAEPVVARVEPRPVRVAAQRVEHVHELAVGACRRPEHDLEDDLPPGVGERRRVERAGVVQFSGQGRRTAPYGVGEGGSVVVHGHLGPQHGLVEGAAVSPVGGGRDQDTVRLEVPEGADLLPVRGGERLGRALEQALHVARLGDHHQATGPDPQHERGAVVPRAQAGQNLARRTVGLVPFRPGGGARTADDRALRDERREDGGDHPGRLGRVQVDGCGRHGAVRPPGRARP